MPPFLHNGFVAVGLYLVLHLLYSYILSKGARPFLAVVMLRASSEVARRLDRAGRMPQDLAIRGSVALGLMAGCALLLGLAIDSIARHPYGYIAQILLMMVTISLMPLLRLQKNVLGQEIKEARLYLSGIIEENLAQADHHTLYRRTLEQMALRLNVDFVGVICWFLLFSSPGMLVYLTVMSLQRASSGHHRFYALPAMLTAKVMNFVPAILTVILMVLASLFVSQAKPLGALRSAFGKDRGYSPWAEGIVLSGMAGATEGVLGGSIKHNGKTIDQPWLGEKKASAKIEKEHLSRGAMIVFIAYLWTFFFLSLAISRL